jgi:hypothetical protein
MCSFSVIIVVPVLAAPHDSLRPSASLKYCRMACFECVMTTSSLQQCAIDSGRAYKA